LLVEVAGEEGLAGVGAVVIRVFTTRQGGVALRHGALAEVRRLTDDDQAAAGRTRRN
jgi:hypothetical protein